MEALTQKWVELSDEELLEKRICDLRLKVAGSDLEDCIQQLHAELESKGLAFRPPGYLADEWFVLEGQSSIGIPFYLAHPRLKNLEARMMLEVEGGSKGECLKLLRHEAGHAIFYAYQLNRRRDVRKVFGPSPKEIPESYRPKPYSKSYVRHLDNWYAQSEPDEDFAETLAVWLTPELDWRSYYKGWPALKKLECVNRVMKEIAGKPPVLPPQKEAFSANRLKLKLKTYYQRKQKHFEQDYPDFYDRDLKAIFATEPTGAQQEPASAFLRRHRKLIVDKVARWTGEKKFILNNLFKKFIERSRGLKMKVEKSEAETLLDITAYLTSMASNYLYTGKFKPTV